jgi:serine/threonine protein kinase
MKQEVRLLFHELADLSPREREQIFRDRRIESGLRAEVEALLGFDSTNHQHLTDRVSQAAEELLRITDGREQGRCGPYRLVRLLGSGGMGAVYLAERTDGEIQQQVAVKLLRFDEHRPAWRDRFLRERQLLASLNHPSIVHVIDAGHTEDGRPYLVMEYVEGTPIDTYAATIHVRDRLALFLRVCEGVSHAHRHLIIHRDLKPSNILVDASGQPKLLDFGIAKLLDETGDATQTVERLLTPNYASPEQLTGATQTTATDIYSMGAVLHKLLTGAVPSDSTPPSRVNLDVPKDLDFIILKALRREPEERYASVEAFATDIRAFLESRPVEARSGNAWYRTRKFLRRYWVPVIAAGLVIASLSAGLYVANRERAIAQRRFQDIRQLSNKLFDIDLQARQLQGSTSTRQLIVDTSLEYLRRLAADAHGDPELALEMGNAYMRVARVEGVPTSPNLGQMDRADRDLQVAEGLVHSVLVSQPANRTALLRSAQIDHDRMILAFFKGHRDEALALARKSEKSLEEFHARKGDEPEAQPVLATYLNLAHQYVRSEQLDDALRICDRAIQMGLLLNIQSYIGNFYWVKAEVFQNRGDPDAALKAVRESLRLLDPGIDKIGQGQQTMGFVQALSLEGKILGQDSVVSLGRYEEAAASLGRSFTIIDGFVHRDTNDQFSRNRLADAGVNLGDVLRHFDARRSLDIYDHTLRHLAEVRNNTAFRRFEVSALAGSSYSLRRLGRPADARGRLDAAFERLRQLKLYPAEKVETGSEAEDALRALAEYEVGTGNFRRATELYQNILDLTETTNSKPENSLTDALDRSSIYRAMSALLGRAAKADLASALEARDRDLWQQWDRKLPNNAFVHRQLESARIP